MNALADILGVKIHKNKWLFKEQDSLQNIIDVLKGEEMLTQFNVDGYRIDLIFQHIGWPLNVMSLVTTIEVLNATLGDKNTLKIN